MEIWKIIVLVITGLWTARLIYRGWRPSHIVEFYYFVFLGISLFIIGEQINWSWLAYKF